MSNSLKPYFTFADWKYCPTTAQLESHNIAEPIILRAKLNLTLKYLVNANGQVVTKQTLIDELWQGNELTGNKGLVDTISALRKTLGQYKAQPIIKTHPKLGYSLNCPVTEHQTETIREVVKYPSKWLIPLVAFCIISCVIMIWQSPYSDNNKQQIKLDRLLTNQAGMKRWPTMTPDGQLLAYVSYFDNPLGNLQLQDQQGKFNTISDGKSMIISPKWSPDGTLLAYLQQGSTSECQLKVYDRRLRISHSLATCRFTGFGGLSWSIDSRHIYFNGQNHDQAGYMSLNIEQDNTTTIIPLTDEELEISYAQWRNSNQLLYIKAKSHMENLLMQYDIKTKQSELITQFGPVVGLSIHPSQPIVTIAEALSESEFAIFDLNLNDKTKTQIQTNGLFLDLAYLTDESLMLSKYQSKQGIISANVTTGEQRKLISSVGWNRYPHYSQSRQALTFQSNRSGSNEIWQYKPATAQITQLTNNQMGEFFHDWSPDGKQMAFVGAKFGSRSVLNLHLFNSEKQQITQLNQDQVESFAPVWHPDGKEILILKPSQKNSNSVYSVNAKSGESHEIKGLKNPESIRFAKEQLFYFNSTTGFITQFIADSEDVPLAEQMQTLDWANWLVTDKQIIYVLRGEKDQIRSWDRQTKQAKTLLTLESGSIFFSRSLAFNSELNTLYICVNQSEDGNIGVYHKTIMDVK